MTPAELADHWDGEARAAKASAEGERDSGLYVRELERSLTLSQCAAQLRDAIASLEADHA